MERKTCELQVILKTKNLCSLIFKATANSPKKFRFSLVSRLQNYSLSALENLYHSNEIFMKNSSKTALEKRISLQRKAFSQLNILTFFIQLSYEQKCILKKEYLSITNQIFECKKLINAWIRSERRKNSENNS